MKDDLFNFIQFN